MHLRLVSKVLSLLSAIVSLSMLWPLVWSLWDGTPDVRAFLLSIAFGLLLALFLYAFGKQADYDDVGWPAGPAILGYDVIDAGPIATMIGYGGNSSNKYRTALFRRTFDVEDAARVTSLTFELLADDGAAIYINGRQWFKHNLPGTRGDGALTTNALAPTAGSEASYVSVVVDLTSFPDLLVDGVNTIAVEVHQTQPTSTDLGFDLEMAATRLPDPRSEGLLANDADGDSQDELVAMLVAGA